MADIPNPSFVTSSVASITRGRQFHTPLGAEAAVRDAVPLYLLIDTGMRIGGVVGADHADLGFQDVYYSAVGWLWSP
ncbi:hypothetical protein ACFV1F_07835 [Streptomyces sp. NPDC059590]|uniref:hypothetical protein n=1 Tax=unclassified Streptomyces TaxID=2593676 RepID=UPI003684C0B1